MKKNRIGQVYDIWIVEKEVGREKQSGKWTYIFSCKCSVCGSKKLIASKRFSKPPICKNGCNKKKKSVKHGMSRTHIYKIWSEMKSRCLNKKRVHYYRYGGRGIKICKRWLKFENFYRDMGDRPSDKHTLDRIDNRKGYSKSNCRWATPQEQANNRSTNVFISAFGERLTISQWARKTGLSKECISYRLKAGWPIEKALTEKSLRA